MLILFAVFTICLTYYEGCFCCKNEVSPSEAQGIMTNIVFSPNFDIERNFHTNIFIYKSRSTQTKPFLCERLFSAFIGDS